MSATATESFPGASALDSSPPSTAVGRVVAERYELVRQLGIGGFGIVFEGFDRTLGVRVALKVLRPDRLTTSAVARLKREVRVARGVESPHLVKVFDIGQDGDLLFVTMEFVDGESLKRLLGKPLPAAEAVRYAIQIAEGLKALHAGGVVHRDVKPGNVLISSDGTAKLCDFGLARSFETEETHPTETGALLGTVAYLAPEQALGRHVDGRADLYALGVVLYEMLAGATPWHADSSLGAVIARLESPAPDVRRVAPGTPAWLAELIACLLERRPENRYASAADLLVDLRREAVGWTRRIAKPRPAFLLGTGLALLAGLAALAVGEIGGHRFEKLVSDGTDGVQALDRRGRILWRRADVSFPSRAVLARIGSSKDPVVAAIARPPGPLDTAAEHTLTILDSRSGSLLRRVPLEASCEAEFRGVSRLFKMQRMSAVDLRGDELDDVILTYAHAVGSASYVVRWDPRRNRSGTVFVATGHHAFALAADVDGDGRKELVLTGINNSLGWANAVSVTRAFDPATGRDFVDEHGSTPDLSSPKYGSSYVDYVLLPRGSWVDWLGGFSLDERGRTLRVSFTSGRRVSVDLAGCGLISGLSRADCVPLREARHRAWNELREAARMSEEGEPTRAGELLGGALSEARTAKDALLSEAVRVRIAMAQIAAGKMAEAEKGLEDLCAGSESCSEIADIAAKTAHLSGNLDLAVRWYGRSMSAVGETGHIFSSAWTIDAAVLALGEMGRWNEAAAFVDRYIGLVPDWRAIHRPWYRWYIAWRTGGVVPGELTEAGVTDTRRYWWLEWKLQRGNDPARLLSDVTAELEHVSGTPGLLLSLRAELEARLGQTAQSLETARLAYEAVAEARTRSVPARAHFDLVAARYVRFLRRIGQARKAAEVRGEAERMARHRLPEVS